MAREEGSLTHPFTSNPEKERKKKKVRKEGREGRKEGKEVYKIEPSRNFGVAKYKNTNEKFT